MGINDSMLQLMKATALELQEAELSLELVQAAERSTLATRASEIEQTASRAVSANALAKAKGSATLGGGGNDDDPLMAKFNALK